MKEQSTARRQNLPHNMKNIMCTAGTQVTRRAMITTMAPTQSRDPPRGSVVLLRPLRLGLSLQLGGIEGEGLQREEIKVIQVEELVDR